MRYQTRIVDSAVEVTSARTGAIHSYEIPPGISPAVYALRCAERVRVSECLAAIRDTRPRHTFLRYAHLRRPGR
jgi:hypothetical protein